MTLHIAALASGVGSNVASIITCIEKGMLDARLVMVLSNKPEAPVLQKAKDKGIPVWAREHNEYPDREAFDTAMATAITEAGADTIVLAGYMRMLSPAFVRAYAGRILNIHPALLPSFPGINGGPDALNYGVRFTGATVHFVDEKADHGPIIIQAVVPIGVSDTEESLMPRIHALEHRIYPQALQWLAEGRLKLDGRRVRLAQGKKPNVSHASYGQTAFGPWMVSPALEGF